MKPCAVDEQQRGRRVLHHRIEQQFTLHEVLPLIAQHTAEFVVRSDELAEVVVARFGAATWKSPLR